MNKPLLSLLIPTAKGRYDQWHNLISKIFKLSGLKREVGKVVGIDNYFMNYWRSDCEVELISCYDEKQLTIGEKRELMYKEANGIFSFQIDDDDDIADDAIELILKAIKENPDVDCVTFRERCIMNGNYKSSNHSLKYEKWQDNFDGFDYVRCPFYKDVIRTDIAKLVPFPFIRYNEDEQWSMAIRPHLKTEHHIDKELYYYIYEPKETHEERYGFNK